MSWRGSFCTEYIYCKDCAAVFLEIAKDQLESATLVHNSIVVAKANGRHLNREIGDAEYFFIPALENRLCCTVRFMVMNDAGGEALFTVKPDGDYTCQMVGGDDA